jgi:hypothetical protein
MTYDRDKRLRLSAQVRSPGKTKTALKPVILVGNKHAVEVDVANQ